MGFHSLFSRSVCCALPLALAVFAATGCGDGKNGTNPGGNPDCAKISAGFSACGGDVKGTWTAIAVCASSVKLLVDNKFSRCVEAEVSGSATTGGTLTLDGTNWVNRTTLTRDLKVTLPTSCLGPGNSVCSDLNAPQGINVQEEDLTTSCVEQGTAACQCKVAETDAANGRAFAYVIENNAIVIQGDGTESTRFCVDGNTLILERYLGTEGALYYVARRQ